MRIVYPPNSIPTKPWVRRWMIWALWIAAKFIPVVAMGIVRAPWLIIKDEWEEVREDVMAFKIGAEDDK